MGDTFSYSFGDQFKGTEKTPGLEAYGLDFDRPINNNLSADIFYTNQGHFPEHHRDGAGVELKYNKEILPRLTVSAGAGPWTYSDTLIPDNGKPAQDLHGIGAMAGVGAAYHLKNHIVLGVGANYYTGKDSFSSYNVLGSVGYDFGATTDGSVKDYGFSSGDSDSSSSANSRNNQVSLMAGEAAVNTPGNVRAVSSELEFRHQLGNSVDVTVSGIDEGKNKFTNRAGIAPELWYRQDVLDNRVSFSIGGGVYAGIDGRKEEEGYSSDRFAAGMISASAAIKLTDHLDARLIWHRVLTTYNRDADVVNLGIDVH
jgi:hypothetical protein